MAPPNTVWLLLEYWVFVCIMLHRLQVHNWSYPYPGHNHYIINKLGHLRLWKLVFSFYLYFSLKTIFPLFLVVFKTLTVGSL